MTPPPFAEVEDLSALPLLNPDLQQRVTTKLRLANGLDVLLISDPAADQAAAAMAVDVGSWDDPAEYPGMAHFCEHMLFRGSTKYPADDEEFMKYVSDGGGSTNAFTASDRTVYMFSSKEELFLQGLDRFSRFFIDPLFKPEHIARELHAVDQEHAKNLEHDGWREYMVFKELNREGHPNRKFSTGNAQTLGKIPASMLKQWYETHYSAERMHLVVYSSLSPEALRASVLEMFLAVRKTNAPKSRPEGPLVSSIQRGSIVYIKPVQERQILNLLWELGDEFGDDPTRSAELLAYALGRGEKTSLYELLKHEGLINDMSVRTEKMGHHPLFQMTLELTPKGVNSLEQVGLHCFEALAHLRYSGVPERLFHEWNRLSALNYQYQPRTSAFDMAQTLAQMLPDEELSTFPRTQLLGSAYDATLQGKLLDSLTPASCCISLSAPTFLSGVEPTNKEAWFQAEYAVRPIPEAWEKTWETARPNPAIQIGEPNPFIPEQFAKVAEGTDVPQLLSDTPVGVGYYVRVGEFTAPNASIHLHIRSKAIDASPKASVLSALYLDHVTDALHPTLAGAKAAGLVANFAFQHFQLHLHLHGFSDKAALLLQEILLQLPKHPPTNEQFAKYVARHERGYANQARELPIAQAKCQLDAILRSEKVLPTVASQALRQLTYEEFLEFHRTLFDKTYVQALFAGNLTDTQAKSAWIDIQHLFSKGHLSKQEFVLPQVLELPQTSGPFEIQATTEAQGNGAILAVDLGAFSFERRAAQEIGAAALREAFFNELRTKQKTGYLARADIGEIEGRLFQYFMVQSNSHQPDDLLHRYELFLEEFLETFKSAVPLDRFETLRNASIHSLQTRFRNLEEKSLLWDLLAFEKGADFQYIDKRTNALQALSYERCYDLVKEMFSRANRRRLAVLIEGRLHAPFTYETVLPSQLLEKSRYTVSSQ